MSATVNPPAAPSLTATRGAQPTGGVQLAWNTPADGGKPITNYKIYRSTSANTEVLYRTVAATNTYLDTTVTTPTRYYYKITAVNSAGESTKSNEVNMIVLNGAKVIIAGDSIIQIAATTIVAALQNVGFNAVNVSAPAATSQGVYNQIVTALGGAHADAYAVIICTGVNDVGNDVADWNTWLTNIVNYVVGRGAVVWSTVGVLADFIQPPLVVTAEQINSVIVYQVAAHPNNFRLFDWNAIVNAVPDPHLTDDGFHPNTAGQLIMANAYKQALLAF